MGERRDDVERQQALLRPPTVNEEITGPLARGTEPRPRVDPTADLIELERKLDRCLGALGMHYQPIVHARSRARFGYEALLRSSDKSLPHPGAILDAAERLERVPSLG